MGRTYTVRTEGSVKESLPDSIFRVELDNGFNIWAHMPEEHHHSDSKILPGDRVKVELTPYDSTNGQIVDHQKDYPLIKQEVSNR